MKNSRKITKAVSLTAAMLMAFSSLTACNKNKVADDENTLEIYITEAGYGKKWLEKLEKIFEAENPEIKVEIRSDKGVSLCNQKVTSGPNINTADLLFTLEDWDQIILAGENAVGGYDYALADMTEFIEKEIDGVKLKDKFRKYNTSGLKMELEEFDWEPHYFALPYAASATGIVYNRNLFTEKGWKLPRTSNELVALAKTIKKAGYIPFCNETSTGYMGYIIAAMWAQYDGADYYYDYISPTIEEDWIEYSTTPSTNGRLYAMKVAQQLFNQTDGLLNPNATADDYGRAQGRLISKQGAMSINGDWFDNEMSLAISQGNAEGNNYASGMMKTPVISALVDQLSFWSEEYSLPYHDQIVDPPVTPYVETFD
ncbi:MAG: extracellular solute-binding protein, partial [Clostridia bacterium]|nr:extracellular solute-binding protein [Clostridia bacterium]